ncbi:PP2C family protein-serine/threonine phosphatase [Kitasatospora sp. DSM 101779]|jgi:serine/threonine protein phosphatase PrpC|uniref:PP2C family protein-serine/threonine phosphatase n=1 Tax=Kitasatospora sp. DSM 101779 TaxID=2853165 RepID=UPI0021D84858|nr:protein phosphatase 2C domain-containing protein [Kitasatospora sp. DSM 101779]MCU7824975.1 protein phosphatase 2C domain-containing protein [Kitasatospora sp. DSM 101779]
MPYIAVSALSHEGLVRDHNEDSLAVGPWTLCATVTESPQTLLFPLGGTPVVVAVADGLGGHPAGEVASSLTARRLAAAGTALRSEDDVRGELRSCNAVLYDAADDDPDLTGMGTTVAGLVLSAEQVLVFNIGDSQVFEIAGPPGAPELRLLSTDDSPPPPPGRRTTNIVTSTLGGTVVRREVEPHLRRLPAAVGARYLVCSDGLTDPVPPEELAAVLAGEDDQRAAFELWRAAIEAGGPDNITLALVRIDE